MPFDVGLNEYHAWVEEQNLAWLSKFGLLEDADEAAEVEKAAFHALAALVHHDDPLESLELASNFISFLFYFDDMVDSATSEIGTSFQLTREVADRMMRGVHGRVPALGDEELPICQASRERVAALQCALADISARLRLFTTDITPYIDAMQEYLDGVVHEAQIRDVCSCFTTVEAYDALRVLVSGVRPCLELGAIVRGIQIPESVRASGPFKDMRRACNLNCSYINDLFSYQKEALVGETSNIVMVIEQASECAPRAALREAFELTSQTVVDYLRASRELEGGDADTAAYMTLMENWMRGNLEWCVTANHRYLENSSTNLVVDGLEAVAV